MTVVTRNGGAMPACNPKESELTQDSFTTSFAVSQAASLAYAAIINPRAWWSGSFEGPADHLGGVFTYRYEHFHYSKQEVTELVPDRRVAWHVLDSTLSFVDDKTEWTETTIVFDIEREGDVTKVTFTHVGLAPAVECYDTCTDAWTSLIQGSLKRLIETGRTDLIELAAPAA